MSLDENQRKPGFAKTDEPKCAAQPNNESGSIFVIQKHAATRLHYDLRLERDGVLKSWAVPKDPPLDRAVKRLAMKVEDHPIEYATFEGTIPEGEYGAGTVEIWDRGTYETEKWQENEIVVNISGSKLCGRYLLIRFKKQEEAWLLFKR